MSEPSAAGPEYVGTSDLARRLNRHRVTVGRWVRQGMFPGAFQPVPDGDWLIPVSAVEQFLSGAAGINGRKGLHRRKTKTA